MRTIVAVLVGIAAQGACRSAGEQLPSIEVSDSAGVKIVVSRGPKWRKADAWSVSPDPHVKIGVLDGPREYELFDVSAAARQSDGDFLVVDGGTREVRLYDSYGTFIRTLGGRGSGPGEFQDPAHVLVTAGDSVIVWDNANYRITRFDAAGEFVSVQSLDRGRIAKAIDPPLFPGTAAALPDGRVLVRLIEKTKYSRTGMFRPQSGALRVSADLSRIDTLIFFGGTERVSVRAPWGALSVIPALAKRTITTVQGTASRVCVGDQERPEIVCFNSDDSRTHVRWSSDAAPVPEQEVATWRDTTLELYTQKMSEAEGLDVLAQVAVPAVRPPYAGLVLDHVGNLWVELGSTTGAAREPLDHLVFDRSGTLLGSVALPAIEVLAIGDDYVMGIHRDELNVEYLHVHEIVKQPARTIDP